MGLHFKPNGLHMYSRAMNSVVISQASCEAMSQSGGPPHPTTTLLSNLAADHSRDVQNLLFRVDPYKTNWTAPLVWADTPLQNDSLLVFTDGSSKHGENSAGGAMWYSTRLDAIVLIVVATLRPSPQAYVPECVGCLIAARFSPVNHGFRLVCDCDSAIATTSRTAPLAWRKRLMAPARPVLECFRAIVNTRSSPIEHVPVKAHTGASDLLSRGNEIMDHYVKEARNFPVHNTGPKIWKQGAEPVILCCDPSAFQPFPTWSAPPQQVIGGVRNTLDRLEQVRLIKRACGTRRGTMVQALVYNHKAVLETVRQLSRAASSKLHALVVLGLTQFLPMENRASFTSAGNACCPNCFTGMRACSSHLFSCPSTLHRARELWEDMETSLQEFYRVMSPNHRVDWRDPRLRLRDRIIRHLAPNLQGSAHRDTPLTLAQLSHIPGPLGRLATSWALCCLGPWAVSLGKACLVGLWRDWLDIQHNMVALWGSTSVISAGPHPGVFLGLTRLFSPIWAVLFDGPAWLAPPAEITWYVTHRATSGQAWPWYAHPVPQQPSLLRIFEWLPLHGPQDIEGRAQVWRRVLGNNNMDSVFVVLLPNKSWTHNILSELPESRLLHTDTTVRLWGQGSRNAPWQPTFLGEVDALLCIVTNNQAWLTTETLHQLIDVIAAGDTLVRETNFLPPAHWWWGPTDSEPPERRFPDHARLALLPQNECADECTAIGGCPRGPTFQPYFGNLGIPPPARARLPQSYP